MNRAFSYNWLKEYVKTGKSAEEFAKELSLKSMTVERVEKVQPKFAGVITAKILEVKKHPNADKLQLAVIDMGKSKLTLVCGASNIAAGQIVPFSPVGAKLQNPAKEGEMVLVKAAEIRGVKSLGMLCSPKELGLGEDHSGIMILPPATKIGVLLEKILNLNDYLFEIEITSNRPDAMSVIGLVREAAAVLKDEFIYQLPKPDLKVRKEISLKVSVLDKKLCPRYLAVVMTGVIVGPSPLWLQQRLMVAGLRPINNLVDITNYVILESGQPMHVFDYEKLAGRQIIVRRAKKGEKILALDGKTYFLNSDNLVIADQNKPVAIAGVMGGEKSAATESTKTIVFESANFNPISVRRTARALNLHSDSSDLFEKNLSIESPNPALLRAIELTKDLAGGQVASKIFDITAKKFKPNIIKFDLSAVKRCLGVEIKETKIKEILKSLGFQVVGSKTLKVIVPWWRTEDISGEHDLIEEIARIYGYHNLPTELPTGEIPIIQKDKRFFWEDKVKDILGGLGFTEIYNYSLISKDLLKKVNFKPGNYLKLFNPLNQDLEYLRPTLIGSILKVVADNQKSFPKQKVFELSNIYLPQGQKDLPAEVPMLSGAILGDKDLFYKIKGIIEFLFKKLQITNYKLQITDNKCPLWKLGQAVDVISKKIFLGQFGLVAEEILEKFDIKEPVALFDLNFLHLSKLAKDIKVFRPIPEFPSIERDLAIVIGKKLSWQEIKKFVKKFNSLIEAVEYLSTYTDFSLGANKKSLAFRIIFRSKEKTLKSEEVDEIIESLIKKLEKEFGAKLR